MTADDEFSDAACAKDNRELMDSRENQLLSKDEIHSLRLQGFTGEASLRVCDLPYANTALCCL